MTEIEEVAQAILEQTKTVLPTRYHEVITLVEGLMPNESYQITNNVAEALWELMRKKNGSR